MPSIKTFVVAVLFLFGTNLFPQSINQTVNNKKEGPWIEESELKEADFKTHNEGNYKNDLKDGKWIEKTFLGGELSTACIGEYVAGEKEGPWVEESDNAAFKTHQEGAYKNNLKHGKWAEKTIWGGRQSTDIGEYIVGKKDGEWTSENNLFGKNSFSKGLYKNNVKEGVWITTSDDKSTYENYIKGELEGEYLIKTESGKLLVKGQMKKGKRNGYFTYYDSTGFVIGGGILNDSLKVGKWIFKNDDQSTSTCNYRNGKMEGKAVAIYKNGITKWIGSFKNDKQIGEWKWYNETGKIISKGKYLNGNKVGKWLETADSGEVSLGSYKNGELDGEWTLYNSNGNVRLVSSYKNGKKDGKWTVYYPNGNIQMVGSYKNGELDGEWLIFNEDKKLKDVKNYINGYEF